MSDPTPATPAPASIPPAKRRSWLTWGLGLAVFGLLLPTLAGMEPARSLVLKQIFRNVQGSVSATGARFSWADATRIDGLQIRSPQGELVVNVESIEVDAPFWKFLLKNVDLGRLTIRRPEVHILVRDGTSNVAQTFPPPKPASANGDAASSSTTTKAPPPANDVAIDVQNAIVSWNLPGTGQTHKVEKINFQAKVVSAGSAGFAEPTLVIDPVVVLDRVQLTQAMSNDFLAFIAPPLAGVTKVEGEVSLALEGGVLPLREPRRGKLSGELAFHRVVAEPSGLPKMIADFVKFQAPNFSFAPESVVPFELLDGKVSHRDLEFGLGAMRVETAGSVALDRKLDLVAHVHLQASPEQVAERPVLRAMSERGLVLPFKGSLDKPEVDQQILSREGIELLSTVLGNWSANRPEAPLPTVAQGVFEMLRERGVIAVPPPSAPLPNTPAPNTPTPSTTPATPAPGASPKPPAIILPPTPSAPSSKTAANPKPGQTETLPAPPGQATSPKPAAATDAIPADAVEIGKQALEVFQELAKQRRERLEQESKQPGATTETPKKRPLGRLLDRLRNTPAEATPNETKQP